MKGSLLQMNGAKAASKKGAHLAIRHALRSTGRATPKLGPDAEIELMPLKTHVEEPPVLNVTSMIDVVFLLLIFFMVSTKFTELERKIGLQVPQVADQAALTNAPAKKVVNVYRDGQITLDRQTVSLHELTGQLAAARGQYADLGVLVRGDGEGQFQRVAEVLNACKQAGVADLAISVRLTHQTR